MNSLRQIYGAPLALWLVAAGGLVTALAADGGADFAAWIGLGCPVVVCAVKIAKQFSRP
ncbi:MAG: hypothetical protein JSR91_15570 [Proteobacteria bacterium]|nr:hypothetical protein [Pseudomonadota bacterium]